MTDNNMIFKNKDLIDIYQYYYDMIKFRENEEK